MALHTQFHRKLDKLWKRRTDELRALIKPKVGKLTFSRRLRNRGIGELIDIASDILVRKRAKREFAATHEGRKLHWIRGRGLDARGEDLVVFAGRFRGPIIYVFWQRKRCLYVGKGRKASRLAGYQRHAFLMQADCIEVFSIPTKNKLPKAECLATHLFKPCYNRVKPARVKWGKRCPVCIRHDAIKHLLSTLFPMP